MNRQVMLKAKLVLLVLGIIFLGWVILKCDDLKETQASKRNNKPDIGLGYTPTEKESTNDRGTK